MSVDPVAPRNDEPQRQGAQGERPLTRRWRPEHGRDPYGQQQKQEKTNAFIQQLKAKGKVEILI